MIGASVQRCPDCGGSGYAPDRNPTGEQPPYLYSSEPCPRCNGAGGMLILDVQLDEEFPRHEEETDNDDSR